MAMTALKHVTRFEYGSALALEARNEGAVPVFGSNGVTGVHDAPNTLGPAIIVGRKGSFGKVTWTERPGFCIDTAYYIDSRSTRANLRWLYWALQTLGLDQHSEDTGVPGLSREKAYQEKLRFPAPYQQERIANFLDEKTARIDALIAEKETLLTSLEEFHRSTLWSLVTKGGSSKNLADSGVEWIGDAPVSWKITAIKWMTPVLRGASPRPIDDPKYFDEQGEYGWVRIADVSASDGILLSTEQRLSKLGESLSVKREPGDLFLSIAGTVGKPCIAGIKCCIHDGFVWFPAIDSNALRGWLFAIFESGFAYAGLGKMGTQLNLNTDTVGSIRVPVPPVEEMLRLLERARKAKAANLALQAHIQRHIDRLREYRSSLISAAVTGQLNIDDFQARQLEAA